jgi:single-stranded-DNA-specific exonuclease
MNPHAITWELPVPVEVPEPVLALVDGNRIAGELLVRRGLADAEQVRRLVDLEAWRPAPPEELPDMAAAVERVRQAAAYRERVGIWGDFDVDGQTATALLVLGLRALGLEPVYYVPLREEGHGIQPDRLESFVQAHSLSLIVTCDTGIAAHEAVIRARGLGVDVIVTDHHKLPEHLPDALACVNPQRLPAKHPMRTMAGVTTAYQLLRALSVDTGHDPGALLDLVALGTIADVALLVDDTRFWVRRGLERLRQSPRLGLQALYALAEIDASRITERDVGFSIGPRLNALGRLGDANLGVELLITSDPERAALLANQIEGLNTQRRFLTKQVYESAERMIEREPALLKYGALILANAHWAPGVVGIVANKLTERYRRPVFMLRLRPDGTASGSARSVEGVDITALIASHSQLTESFGGHAMAAGVTLQAGAIEDFRRALSVSLAESRPEVSEPHLKIDAVAAPDEINAALMRTLTRLAPFGAGFPAPTLMIPDVTASMRKSFGRQGEHLRFTVEDATGASAEVLWWGGNRDAIPDGRFDLAVEVYESTFRGETRIELELLAIESREAIQATAAIHLQIVDLRHAEDAEAALRGQIVGMDDVTVWSEHVALTGLRCERLHELGTARTLVIWSTPPDRATVLALFQRATPDVVIVVAADGRITADSADALRAVGGMLQQALRSSNGELDLMRAAPRANLSHAAFVTALRWWEARGSVKIINIDDQQIVVERAGQGTDQEIADGLAAALRKQVSEIAAFQRYFLSAPESALPALFGDD